MVVYTWQVFGTDASGLLHQMIASFPFSSKVQHFVEKAVEKALHNLAQATDFNLAQDSRVVCSKCRVAVRDLLLFIPETPQVGIPENSGSGEVIYLAYNVRIWVMISRNLGDTVQIKASNGEFDHGNAPSIEAVLEQLKLG